MGNSLRQKVDKLLPVTRGKREWEIIASEYGVCFWENVLEFDSDDRYTAVWMLLKTTELYSLEGWTLWQMIITY